MDEAVVKFDMLSEEDGSFESEFERCARTNRTNGHLNGRIQGLSDEREDLCKIFGKINLLTSDDEVLWEKIELLYEELLFKIEDEFNALQQQLSTANLKENQMKSFQARIQMFNRNAPYYDQRSQAPQDEYQHQIDNRSQAPQDGYQHQIDERSQAPQDGNKNKFYQRALVQNYASQYRRNRNADNDNQNGHEEYGNKSYNFLTRNVFKRNAPRGNQGVESSSGNQHLFNRNTSNFKQNYASKYGNQNMFSRNNPSYNANGFNKYQNVNSSRNNHSMFNRNAPNSTGIQKYLFNGSVPNGNSNKEIYNGCQRQSFMTGSQNGNAQCIQRTQASSQNQIRRTQPCSQNVQHQTQMSRSSSQFTNRNTQPRSEGSQSSNQIVHRNYQGTPPSSQQVQRNPENQRIKNVHQNVLSKNIQQNHQNANQIGNQNVIQNVQSKKNESAKGETLFPTAMVAVKGKDGEIWYLRALLDQCSEAAYMKEATAKKLKLKQTPVPAIEVSSIDEVITTTVNKTTKFEIVISKDESMIVHANVVHSLVEKLPRTEVKMPENLFKNLKLADPTFAKPEKIDIILGSEMYAKLLLNGMIKEGGYVAQNTKLGWIISGRSEEERQPEQQSMCGFTRNKSKPELNMKNWSDNRTKYYGPQRNSVHSSNRDQSIAKYENPSIQSEANQSAKTVSKSERTSKINHENSKNQFSVTTEIHPIPKNHQSIDSISTVKEIVKPKQISMKDNLNRIDRIDNESPKSTDNDDEINHKNLVAPRLTLNVNVNRLRKSDQISKIVKTFEQRCKLGYGLTTPMFMVPPKE